MINSSKEDDESVFPVTENTLEESDGEDSTSSVSDTLRSSRKLFTFTPFFLVFWLFF